MEAKDRVIVALDVDNLDKAKSLVESLAPYVGCFKVGLELLTAVGGPKVVEFVHSLGGQVFYDGKFKDKPKTVAGASRAVTRLGVKMFDVHCLGGIPMMKAARDAVEAEWIEMERLKVFQHQEPFQTKPPLILGVTLLTSLNYDDMVDLGVWSSICTDYEAFSKEQIAAKKRERVQLFVASLANSAQKAKLDGVISSPQEIEIIRKRCGPDFKIITPGVRPVWADVGDQKRVKTPAEAISDGADYVVIGEPITDPKVSGWTPADAAFAINKEIDAALMIRGSLPSFCQ